jgi:hypothetical protein
VEWCCDVGGAVAVDADASGGAFEVDDVDLDSGDPAVGVAFEAAGVVLAA